jgi:hypothetical protein
MKATETKTVEKAEEKPTTEKPTTGKPSDPADAAADVRKQAAASRRRRGECVVDDGTAHMGRATPGAAICSAHAMHYKADGTRR